MTTTTLVVMEEPVAEPCGIISVSVPRVMEGITVKVASELKFIRKTIACKVKVIN